jgi:transposase
MGIQAIKKPDHFTEDWYNGQKKLGKPDALIADELHVGITTFKKWKRKVGITTFEKVRIGMQPILKGMEQELIIQYRSGLTYDQLAKEFYVSKETIRKELRKMGVRKKVWQTSAGK